MCAARTGREKGDQAGWRVPVPAVPVKGALY